MPPKISSYKRIVVLTGAGISAESGISTFRHAGGPWENHRIEDVTFTLVSQNVDMLHERSSHAHRAPGPLAMHGTLSLSRCSRCETLFRDLNIWLNDDGTPPSSLDLELPQFAGRTDGTSGALTQLSLVSTRLDASGLPLSPCCQRLLRPHIVWFGEMPLFMDEIQQAKFAGAATICLNREPLPQQGMVDFYSEGPATQTVPRLFV